MELLGLTTRAEVMNLGLAPKFNFGVDSEVHNLGSRGVNGKKQTGFHH